MIPKVICRKGEYKSVEGIFIGYYNNSKAYKVWIPQTQMVIKARDVIFDESNYIERVTIHATDDDDLPDLWNNEIDITVTPSNPLNPGIIWNEGNELPFPPNSQQHPEQEIMEKPSAEMREGNSKETERDDKVTGASTEKDEKQEAERTEKEDSPHASPDFEKGPWLDPTNVSYGRGQRHKALYTEVAAFAHGTTNLEHTEHALIVLAEDEPENYKEAMNSLEAQQWRESMKHEYETLMGYRTWTLVDQPPNTNIIGSRWTFRVKRDNLRKTNDLKS